VRPSSFTTLTGSICSCRKERDRLKYIDIYDMEEPLKIDTESLETTGGKATNMETPLKVNTTDNNNNTDLQEPRATLMTKEELMQKDLADDGFVEDMDKKNVVKDIHDDVAEWIQEYFQFQGYAMTLDCFQAEFLSKKYAVNVENAVNGTDLAGLANNRKRKIEKIMRFFDEGNTKSFVHEWNSSVPLHVREAETDARKAFFMAQVYFLVCAFKESQAAIQSGKTFSPRKTKGSPRLARSPSKRQMRSPALQTALDRYRAYLEDEGGDVTTIEPSLGKYHALMYVSNPSRNSEFQHLFEANSSKQWVNSVRKNIENVLGSVLENVPMPRLLQMYESFMTSYKGFDEQLKTQQEMAFEMQRIAKRLFQLSVKVSRDASAMIQIKSRQQQQNSNKTEERDVVENNSVNEDNENKDVEKTEEKEMKNDDNDNESNVAPQKMQESIVLDDPNAEIINSDYIFRVRQTLRECRDELKGASIRRKRKTPKDMNAAFTKKLPPFLMGQPPPLDYSKVREVSALAGDTTSQLLDALWWRLVYSTPPAMGHVISNEKFKILQSEMRHNVARDILDGDIFWITRKEKDRDTDALIRECLALSPTHRPQEMPEHAMLRAASIRVIDAFSSWQEGRNYLKRLSKDIPFLIVELVSNNVLLSEGIPSLALSANSTDITRARRITRRHSINFLLKFSTFKKAREIMIENKVQLYIAKMVIEALSLSDAGDLREGVVRRAMALLLNLLTEGKTFDLLDKDEEDIVKQTLEACCLTMESSNLKGKAGDRSGRRYASAAMYGMLSQASCCEKSKSFEPRIKTLIQKHALIRSDRFFVHELECILLRMNGNESENATRPKPPKEDPENEQDQYDSDSEDFIGEFGGLEATPVQGALTRSEVLLRSSQYSFKEKIVPGENQAIRSILDAVEDDTEEAQSMLENLNYKNDGEEDEYV
jgi:hypothetical protein